MGRAVQLVACRNETSVHVNVTAAPSRSLPGVQRSTPRPAPVIAALPPKGEQEREHKSSMAIFFILFVIGQLASFASIFLTIIYAGRFFLQCFPFFSSIFCW